MNDLSVGLSVCPSVCLCSALWKNGGLDPDAVWHRRSDGSRDEVGGGIWRPVHRRGTFWGELGHAIVHRDLLDVHVLQGRDAALLPNYFGQTCSLSSLVSHMILVLPTARRPTALQLDDYIASSTLQTDGVFIIIIGTLVFNGSARHGLGTKPPKRRFLPPSLNILVENQEVNCVKFYILIVSAVKICRQCL